jgi:short-subunit dehydrogenase
LHLAKENCNLAISDVNMKGIEETKQICLEANKNIKISTRKLDVANKDDFYKYAQEVKEDFGKVNMMINNAGVALAYKFNDLPMKEFEWLMNINFWGVIYGTSAFLPILKEAPKGEIARVVNISSLFGTLGFTG